jgi:hypothetical protein
MPSLPFTRQISNLWRLPAGKVGAGALGLGALYAGGKMLFGGGKSESSPSSGASTAAPPSQGPQSVPLPASPKGWSSNPSNDNGPNYIQNTKDRYSNLQSNMAAYNANNAMDGAEQIGIRATDGIKSLAGNMGNILNNPVQTLQPGRMPIMDYSPSPDTVPGINGQTINTNSPGSYWPQPEENGQSFLPPVRPMNLNGNPKYPGQPSEEESFGKTSSARYFNKEAGLGSLRQSMLALLGRPNHGVPLAANGNPKVLPISAIRRMLKIPAPIAGAEGSLLPLALGGLAFGAMPMVLGTGARISDERALEALGDKPSNPVWGGAFLRGDLTGDDRPDMQPMSTDFLWGDNWDKIKTD